MTKLNEVYKCNICGNIVEMLHPGNGILVCCGQSMVQQIDNTVDASLEKHVPVLKKIEGGYKVKVGSQEHPMSTEHHIEWIELLIDDEVYRQNLAPEDKPEAIFYTEHRDKIIVRAYCNLHGLWTSDE